jgi:hypothetical protein
MSGHSTAGVVSHDPGGTDQPRFGRTDEYKGTEHEVGVWS